MRSWVENPTEGGRGGKEERGELVVWAELELETEFCTCPSNDEEAGFSWLRRSDPVQLMATFRLAAVLCCGRRGPRKNESLEGRRKEIIELNICSLPSSSSSPTIFAFLSRFRSTCNTSSPASDPFSDLQDHPEISVARPTFPFVSHVSLLPLCTPAFLLLALPSFLVSQQPSPLRPSTTMSISPAPTDTAPATVEASRPKMHARLPSLDQLRASANSSEAFLFPPSSCHFIFFLQVQ